MAVALVGSPTTPAMSGSAVTSLTVSPTTSSGNQVLLGVVSNTSVTFTVQSVSDNGSTPLTWTKVASHVFTGNNEYDIEWWQGGPSTIAATITITVTMTGATFIGLSALELSGASTGSWATNALGADGSSTTATVGAITVANAGSFVAIGSNNSHQETASPSTPWTANGGALFSGNQFCGIAYQQASSNTSSTSWTAATGSWTTLGVVVPPAATVAPFLNELTAPGVKLNNYLAGLKRSYYT